MKILLFILIDSILWLFFTMIIYLGLIVFYYFFSGELNFIKPGNLIAIMIISLIPSTIISYTFSDDF